MTATASDKYKMLTQREHVLYRPDSYIGSISNVEEPRWVIDPSTKHFKRALVKNNPGLEQCIIELITNAIDHSNRKLEEPVTKIEITLTDDIFTIKNDGSGIPIEIHKEHKIYIPELIFGNLLTSSNYDDTEKRQVMGTNGIGAKACNVFATEFTLELRTNNVKYTQTFSENLLKKTEPVIKSSSGKDYTKIIYKPDFKAFKLTKFTEDIKKVITKRIYDCAAMTSKKVKIYLNDLALEVKDFKDYVKLYLPEGTSFVHYESDRWAVCFCKKPEETSNSTNSSLSQISFVNGIATEDGGTHVNYVLNPVIKKVTEVIQEMSKVKKEKITIKSTYISDHIVIFLRCIIDNPRFNSQTKTCLKTPSVDFGSKFVVPDEIITKISKLGFVDDIIQLALFKEKKNFEKATSSSTRRTSRLLDVPNLDDAIKAGTNQSDKCTIIFTEGLSAKATVMSGLSVIGNEYWGVFPLKGKVLNVKTATLKQLTENEELININKILGLAHNMTNKSQLRYGKVMIVSDQDSVSGDTPVTLRGYDGHATGSKGLGVVIKNIEDICSGNEFSKLVENNVVTTKEYCVPANDTFVWTSQGWSKIKHVMRHHTTKKMFRVLTHSGCVDVTEDHSLLDKDGKKIRPSECSVDSTELLHSFPEVEDDGSESESDSDSVLSECTDDQSFYFTNKHKAQCYYSHLMGWRCDDENAWYGFSDVKVDLLPKGSTVKNWFTKEYVKTTMDQYILTKIPKHDKNYKQTKPNAIKKIIELEPVLEGHYVYDLETENHQFQAGIGSLIVSNTDGFHIKGLLMNYFTHFWPDIVKDSFLSTLLTPIVKVSYNNKVLDFYNLYDYTDFVIKHQNEKFTQKYYKGLGTSSVAEAKDYFKNIAKNQLKYTFDPTKDKTDILLAFEKKQADNRKEWISGAITKFNKNNSQIDYTTKVMSVKDFINNELVQFSIYDCTRSLPSMIDGLKVSQRKVLYGSIKKKIFNKSHEIKVAQLGSYISEQTEYHHGEVSLHGTIVNMAQEFVGSGNMQLFVPSGQFGSRNNGGADSASPRYIFTYLRSYVQTLFNPTDSELLEYNYEDSVKIEPKKYVPVLPMVLLNGSTGIATGWSCDVPCFNPVDVIANLKRLLEGKKVKKMKPFYKGFNGTIVDNGTNKWISRGQFSFVTSKTGSVNKKKITVTELPIGLWYENFKNHLKKLELESFLTYVDRPRANDGKSSFDYIDFDITFNNELEEIDIITLLKLETQINATNMVGFDKDNNITKYKSAEHILESFYECRLGLYTRRKKHIEEMLEKKLHTISEKARFIRMVVEGSIVVFKRKTEDVVVDLEKHGFSEIDELLRLSLNNFTSDKVLQLEKEIKSIEQELSDIRALTEKDLWSRDLKDLESLVVV